MKYFIFFCQCLFIGLSSFCQLASQYYKKADSLYKIQEFQNAAIAYATAIRNDNDAGIGKYWNCACSWSLAGNADSAFHYLKYLENSGKTTILNTNGLTEEEDFIFIRSDKRWKDAITRISENAINNLNHFANAVRNGERLNPVIDRYNIAVAWAVTKNADSALYYLNSIINAKSNHYTDHQQLSTEKAFFFLWKDQQWISLLAEVKKKSISLSCEHTPREWRKPMTFTIDPQSKFLKSDGKGIYKNNEERIASYFITAYNFLTSGIILLQESGNLIDTSSRYFVVDLNSPVKSSGAFDQGIIADHFASFHAFYKIDTSSRPSLIFNLNEMPVGVTIESPRTEIYLHINGLLHILHFGYWGLGDCGEVYSRGARITGNGTTLVKITRHTETSYTIEAPARSIGRLWDIANLSKPIDKGLFESGFIVHVENQ